MRNKERKKKEKKKRRMKSNTKIAWLGIVTSMKEKRMRRILKYIHLTSQMSYLSLFSYFTSNLSSLEHCSLHLIFFIILFFRPFSFHLIGIIISPFHFPFVNA
jgi:hypothetical protein